MIAELSDLERAVLSVASSRRRGRAQQAQVDQCAGERDCVRPKLGRAGPANTGARG